MENTGSSREEIKRKTKEVWALFEDFRTKLDELQDECSHPIKSVSVRGYTDNLIKQHWVEYKCPDCRKKWKEDV